MHTSLLHCFYHNFCEFHYSDVKMGAMASQITSVSIVYSTVYSGADQRKHQSSASLAFVRGIHRWLVNSPHNMHKGPVTRNMFPFDDVIMYWGLFTHIFKFCFTGIIMLYKHHNASVLYPTMHHFVTEMCPFLLQNGTLCDISMMHCGTLEMMQSYNCLKVKMALSKIYQ